MTSLTRVMGQLAVANEDRGRFSFRGNKKWVRDFCRHSYDLMMFDAELYLELDRKLRNGREKYLAKIVVYKTNDSGFEGRFHYVFGFKIDELVWEYYDLVASDPRRPGSGPRVRELQGDELPGPDDIEETIELHSTQDDEGVFDFDTFVDLCKKKVENPHQPGLFNAVDEIDPDQQPPDLRDNFDFVIAVLNHLQKDNVRVLFPDQGRARRRLEQLKALGLAGC
ncbi:hypothetical protein QBC46DRAFT_394999 [Diplogelasinospora grovesii]|uniref:Uncharacterized protein n=1 Tax=Diplogelasinospora grovesii TaxID=303347 RepID=A0AAN6MZW0_9PEZI|nr:hypothetical protein QBC46DRAFT_394999 [Diplogelasinospora grovesii]